MIRAPRVKVGDLITCSRPVRSGTWAHGKPGVYSVAAPGAPLRVVDARPSRQGKRLMVEGMGAEGWICTWVAAQDCVRVTMPTGNAAQGRPVWWDRRTWDPDFGGECA